MNKKIIVTGSVLIVLAIAIFAVTYALKKDENVDNKLKEYFDESLVNCGYDGELYYGLEYVKDDYTYTYIKIDDIDGWKVQYSGYSEKEIQSPTCALVADLPIISAENMYNGAKAQVINVSEFYSKNVINMHGMFSMTPYATEIVGLGLLDTENVKDMSGMFYLSGAKIVDLSNLDTRNVEDMSSMFDNCLATTIDVGGFNTSKVKYMERMFAATFAKTVDVSTFDLSNVLNMNDMFSGSFIKTYYVGNNAAIWEEKAKEFKLVSTPSKEEKQLEESIK